MERATIDGMVIEVFGAADARQALSRADRLELTPAVRDELVRLKRGRRRRRTRRDPAAPWTVAQLAFMDRNGQEYLDERFVGEVETYLIHVFGYLSRSQLSEPRRMKVTGLLDELEAVAEACCGAGGRTPEEVQQALGRMRAALGDPPGKLRWALSEFVRVLRRRSPEFAAAVKTLLEGGSLARPTPAERAARLVDSLVGELRYASYRPAQIRGELEGLLAAAASLQDGIDALSPFAAMRVHEWFFEKEHATPTSDAPPGSPRQMSELAFNPYEGDSMILQDVAERCRKLAVAIPELIEPLRAHRGRPKDTERERSAVRRLVEIFHRHAGKPRRGPGSSMGRRIDQYLAAVVRDSFLPELAPTITRWGRYSGY